MERLQRLSFLANTEELDRFASDVTNRERRTATSITVSFGEDNEPIKLLIGLSAADSDSHIGAIQALSELLCEEENLAALLAAKSEKQLADIISRA